MVEQYVLEFVRAEQADDPYAFRFRPQAYLLRTGGGGFQTAEFPWDQALLSDLAAIRLPRYDPAVVQRIGETLRRFLGPLGFAEHEAQILSASRAGREVLLTIRSAAAELYALPWELLTLKSTGQHLGGLPNVLIQYEWPETSTTPESASPGREGGRILLAWSAAAGAVPAREHAQAILAACRAGSLPFDSATDILPQVSCGRLVAALEASRVQGQTIAVLHLLCHGSAAGSTFGLALDGEEPDQTVVMDAGRLRQLLAPFSDMVRLVVLCACDSGNSGALGNHLGSVAQTLHRAGFAQVIASRHPLSVLAANQLTQTLYRELIAETQSVQHALRAVRNRLARDAAHLEWANLQLYCRPEDGYDSRPVVFRPFRGLLAFQPQHGRFFFGRDREIEQVVTALGELVQAGGPPTAGQPPTAGRPRFLVVAGASGSGKSSLVLAGAVPRLLQAAGEALQLSVMQPGRDPLRALSAALSAAQGPGAAKDVLLVVDQFEEIFTQVADPAVRQDFVQRLWRLAEAPASGTRIIVTLRVDFLGECGGIVLDPAGRRLDSVAYDQAHRIFVAQLGVEQLRAAIEGPARRVGLILESGLTNRMLEAVGAEPGALPLLEYTLDLLWLRRDGRTLTQAGYDAVGQIAGALSQHADALLHRLSEAEQQIAHRLLVRLVHLGDGVAYGTRQRVTIQPLRPTSAEAAIRFDHVLAELVDARLLCCSGAESDQTVEVAHEALIRRWPRLAEWLQKDRELLAQLEKLEALLVQWRVHKVLLTGEQLRFAESVERHYPDDFPDQARTLLRASQKEERWNRFFKRLPTVLLLTGTVLIGFLLYGMGDANEKVEFARDELVSLLSQTSRRPSSAEMLRTLARLRLELELKPDLALEVITQARDQEPQNPRLLADRAEYLVATGRFDQVGAIAQTALLAETAPESRLHIAVVAWSAARFRSDRGDEAVWAARVNTEYAKLPDGAKLHVLAGTSQILFREQFRLRVSLPLPHILQVYRIIGQGKSAGNKRKLENLLRQDR